MNDNTSRNTIKKKKSNTKSMVAVIASAALAAPALALDKMPEEPGLSGFVNLAVGSGSIESNFLARVAGIDLDLGDDTLSDFGSPDDENITTGLLNLTVAYTFSNLKTQVSLGNDLTDFLQFDRSTVASLRHDVDSLGRFQLSVLSSAFPSTEVWEDPYVLGAKRKETERESTGGRFTWDRIFGTRFELKVQSREIDLDNERSGEALGLSTAERALLDREGDNFQVELGYLMVLDDGANVFRPSVTYIDKDLDGDAMAQEGVQAGFSWLYSGERLTWANNLFYTVLDGDAKHPIFNEDNDADTLTFASQAFFPRAFGLEHWQPNLAVLYGDHDSDVDFNDGSGWMIAAGIGRRF